MSKPKTKLVYRYAYAIQMQILGHQLLTTITNPNDTNYNIFVFKDDQTFDSDLHQIIEEGRKNHG